MITNLIDRKEYSPFIVTLAGPPLSGKTTLAGMLRERTNLVHLDIDEQGAALEGVLGSPSKNWFANSMRMMVKYAHAHRMAGDELLAGNPVILTATYSHETYEYALRSVLIDTYRRFAKLEQPPSRIFELDAPIESLAERIIARNMAGSASDISTMEQARSLREEFVHLSGNGVIKIHTELPIEQNIAQVLAAIEPFRKTC